MDSDSFEELTFKNRYGISKVRIGIIDPASEELAFKIVPHNSGELAKFFLEAKKLADSGDPSGCVDAGCCYAVGFGVDQDAGTAVKYFRRAAVKGHCGAMVRLALLYAYCCNEERGRAKAMHWLQFAANLGHSEAMFQAGNLCYEGITVDQDYSEAAKWYRKAAGKDHPMAQFVLGMMYEKGEGVEEDLREAMRWFQRASVNGVDETSERYAECIKREDG